LPDDLARQELKTKFSGDERRAEETKQALHWGIICFVRTAAVIVTVIFAVRMAYFVLPSGCRWLTDEQVRNMDDFLFHGTIGGILGMYLKKSLQSSRDKE
jgi:hypothetical protein